MSGIAGIVSLEDAPLASDMLAKMVDVMAFWGPGGIYQHQSENGSLAYLHAPTTPEARYERQPYLLPNGKWLIAAARLDNRTELIDTLKIEHEFAATLSDGALIGQTYLRWGEEVVHQLLGDWSLAVWNPATRHLFLARDQLGNTSLYYHANARYLAFASSIKALLALDTALHTIDDLYVAQVILSWPAYHGPRTTHPHIYRLPPAHYLTASPKGHQTQLYCRIEENDILPLRSLDEAVEGFRFHFDRAVQSRLRSTGPVATTLSGGLDSGSVTATAAALLAAQNRALTAYTSIPITGDLAGRDKRFGNEWEMAAATAAFAKNIDHKPIDAQQTTPLAGVEEMLWAHDAPTHSSANGYWITELLKKAKCDGASVLLTGQMGNATISWSGFVKPQPIRDAGFYQGAKELFLRHTPRVWGNSLVRWKMNHEDTWIKDSFAGVDLVRRTRVVDLSMDDPFNTLDIATMATPLEQRCAILKPGRSIGGALWHESAAAYGIDVRDPTQDVRLVRYCLSIPDHFFSDNSSGLDRMIIRQAMKGRLPDVVRLNRKRGLQAADLVTRLAADRDTLAQIIEHFAAGPAAHYLNLEKVRRTWQAIQQGDSNLQHPAGLLLRAVMAGLFVERPQYPRPRPQLYHDRPSPIASPTG